MNKTERPTDKWSAVVPLTLPRRPPTAAECELVGRDTSYAEATPEDVAKWGWADFVIEVDPEYSEVRDALVVVLEGFADCDCAHAIPAGVYAEE
jgi:hypothetical protein